MFTNNLKMLFYDHRIICRINISFPLRHAVFISDDDVTISLDRNEEEGGQKDACKRDMTQAG